MRSAEFLVFVVVIFSSLYFTEFTYQTSNFKSRYFLTRAIVDEGTFQLDSYSRWLGHDQGFYDGHKYSEKPPGSSFLMIPAYALVAKPLVSILQLAFPDLDTARRPENSGVITAWLTQVFSLHLLVGLGFVFLLKTLKLLNLDEKALPCTLLCFYGTLFFPYSTIGFGAMYAVPFLFSGSYFLLRASSSRDLLWAGFSFGIVFLIKTEAALFSVPAFLFVVFAHRNFASLVRFVLPICACIAVQLLYNFINFDSVFSFPIHHYAPAGVPQAEGPPIFTIMRVPSGQDFYLMLFSPWKGIFLYSPFLLFALPGFFSLARKNRAFSLYLLASFLIMFGFFALLPIWKNGYNFGFRYIVPALVFLAIPASYWLSTRGGNSLVKLTVGVSLLLNSFVAITIVRVPSSYKNPLLEYNLRVFQKFATNNIFSDLLASLGITGWWYHFATLGFFCLCMWLILRFRFAHRLEP